jgi:hypothetical protein
MAYIVTETNSENNNNNNIREVFSINFIYISYISINEHLEKSKKINKRKLLF